MGRYLYLLLFAVSCALNCACGPDASEEPDFTVAAAASLTTVMEEALERWNATHESQGRSSYASSSTLARQLEQGAPFDLYVSANAEWMDRAIHLGHVDGSTRRDLAGNELVLVAPREGALSAADLPLLGPLPPALAGLRWSTGDPEHVPLGRYARESLEALDWWQGAARELIAGGDARAALRLVERGEVDWGIVYRTDAEESAGVRVLASLPASSHSAVVYPLAQCMEASEGARDFARWLTSPAGRALFQSHGFRPMKQELAD